MLTGQDSTGYVVAWWRWRSGLTLAIAVCSMATVLTGCGGGSGKRNQSASTAPVGASTRPGGSPESGRGTAANAPGNAVAALSPQEIVKASVQAIDQVNSVHVVGSVVDGGILVHLDLRLVRGRGGGGEVSENGLAFRLIAIGSVLYIQGSDAFWSHFGGATAAKIFHDKWLKAPVGGQFASIGALTSIPHLFGQLLRKHGSLSRSRRAIVNGQPALEVIDRTEGGTLLVATTGRPYPLQIVKRGSDAGSVTFNDFNQSTRLVAPAKSIAFPQAG